MNRNQTDISREKWEKILKEKESSPLTLVEFCSKRGITLHSYYYWRKKLNGSKPGKQRKAAAQFVPLKINTPSKNIINFSVKDDLKFSFEIDFGALGSLDKNVSF
jgi:hypothetical protein